MDSDVPAGCLRPGSRSRTLRCSPAVFVLVPRSHKLGQGRDENKAAAYRVSFAQRQALTSATIGSDMKTKMKRRLEEATLLHRAISDAKLSVVAPALQKGRRHFLERRIDPWKSAARVARLVTRNSLTAHYIADTQALMVQGRRADFATETHHGMKLRMTIDQRPRQPSS